MSSRAILLTLCAALLTLFLASSARAAELVDVDGGLRLPLDAAGVRPCVFAPRELRDPEACVGLEALHDVDAKVPAGKKLLTAVARVDSQTLVEVSVYRVEGAARDLTSLASAVMAGQRQAIKPPSTVIEDRALVLTRVGNQLTERAFSRVDLVAPGGVHVPMTRTVSVFAGRDCNYVASFAYSSPLEVEAHGYEVALLSGVEVDRRPSFLRGLHVSERAFLVVIGVALALAMAGGLGVVWLLTRRDRRRRPGQRRGRRRDHRPRGEREPVGALEVSALDLGSGKGPSRRAKREVLLETHIAEMLERARE